MSFIVSNSAELMQIVTQRASRGSLWLGKHIANNTDANWSCEAWPYRVAEVN